MVVGNSNPGEHGGSVMTAFVSGAKADLATLVISHRRIGYVKLRNSWLGFKVAQTLASGWGSKLPAASPWTWAANSNWSWPFQRLTRGTWLLPRRKAGELLSTNDTGIADRLLPLGS